VKRTLHIADLFCGAGGTSHGAIQAVEALGYKAKLTAINHWNVAIATHQLNNPEARHLCTYLDNINPRDLFKEGELDVLWASPECTHHSIARGGKPINDQSRATAWCVVRWAEALRPNIILVENVPEFVSWGGIGTNGRPLATKKGATFMAWVGSLESLGYRVGWKILCAADHGDPTTRRRLFVQAVRGHRKIKWPEPSHSPKAKTDLLGSRQPYRNARNDVIDWSLLCPSIYDRKRPLSPKTMRRIYEGLKRFGLGAFVVPQQSNPVPKSVDEPLPTVVAEGSRSKLVTPFLVNTANGKFDSAPSRVGSVESPGSHRDDGPQVWPRSTLHRSELRRERSSEATLPLNCGAAAGSDQPWCGCAGAALHRGLGSHGRKWQVHQFGGLTHDHGDQQGTPWRGPALPGAGESRQRQMR
jgi:DNA (cytosine-5)-methyltransferase 1